MSIQFSFKSKDLSWCPFFLICKCYEPIDIDKPFEKVNTKKNSIQSNLTFDTFLIAFIHFHTTFFIITDDLYIRHKKHGCEYKNNDCFKNEIKNDNLFKLLRKNSSFVQQYLILLSISVSLLLCPSLLDFGIYF